jgi:5-methylcytosine-specific restriction endonuclease McrA
MERLASLSDDALLHELHALVGSHRRVTAELILHLGEVDTRRLYADKGFTSLFSYCVEQLLFSEDEACRRIEAARLARRFPAIYALLQAGTVSLTVLGLLKSQLTDANHHELLAGVSRSSVRQAKEWLAARFPEPDVPSTIRKQAARRPARVMQPLLTTTWTSPTASASTTASASPMESVPSGAEGILRAAPPAPARAHIDPLSQDRFLVKFTASRAMREKLELARDLMLRANPKGDLAVVLERAVDLLVAELQKRQQGRTSRPQKKPRAAQDTAVTRAARREVVARDGWRCSFVADDGRRCDARGFLEFDHKTPKGRGGSSEAKNLRVLCRAHNRLAAERVFGKAHVANAISASRSKTGKTAGSSGVRETVAPDHRGCHREPLRPTVENANRDCGDCPEQRSTMHSASSCSPLAVAVRGRSRAVTS